MDVKQIKPSTYEHVHRIPVKMQAAEQVRGELRAELEQLKLERRLEYQILLCIDEAISNAIEHGSVRIESEVEIAYTLGREWVEVAVTDYGGFVFNPEYFERLATVKDWGEGGRGILLIKTYMDEVYFVFHPGKSTRVIMRKKVAAAEANKEKEATTGA